MILTEIKSPYLNMGHSLHPAPQDLTLVYVIASGFIT